MLSFNAAYAAQASGQNIVTDWLLSLAYDDTTPGVYYFSGQDLSLTNEYRGLVEDWGSISESIDLAKSRASISDVEITLINKWANVSGLLSAELYGGSKNFINQDVTIISYIPGCTLAECPIIYKGRLVDIKHNKETVSITLEKRSPWYKVKMPDLLASTDAADGEQLPTESIGVAKPISYGDLIGNQGNITAASIDLTRGASFSPMAYLGVDTAGKHRWLVADHEVEQITANEDVWGWDSYTSRMVRLSAFTVEQNTSAGCIISHAAGEDFYDYWYSDGATTFVSQIGTPTITTIEKAANKSATDYGNISAADLGGGPAEEYSFKVVFQAWDNANIADGDIAEILQYTLTAFGSDGTDAVFLADGQDLTSEIGSTYNSYSNTADQSHIQADITFVLTASSDGGGLTVGKVYQCFKRIKYLPSNPRLQLYFGGLGLEKATFTGGTALDANLFHRVFRDMLKTWTGWDATGLDYVEVNGTDWSGSSIDTDRDWLFRGWFDKNMELEGALEQIQFEGCFIWVFDETSSGLEARVIYVADSYAATDIDLDGANLGNIKINHIPLSNIISQRKANYDLQPATSDYAHQNSKSNANRADFNFGTAENVVEENLDFMTATGDVDSFLTYYDNIEGEPKIIVSCDLLKPADRALQVGDIVKFENMDYEPYGKTWATPIYFMCTETRHSPMNFNATFREVG